MYRHYHCPDCGCPVRQGQYCRACGASEPEVSTAENIYRGGVVLIGLVAMAGLVVGYAMLVS